jgi:hypothetical protein
MTTNSFQVDMNGENEASTSDELEKIINALWNADDSDYWQKGLLLEKGAALGDFLSKFKFLNNVTQIK